MEEINILILTLDEELKSYLSTLLSGEGHQVFLTNDINTENFFKELTEKKINLLILDFDNINVLEICKKVRSNFTIRHIPILVLTNQDETMPKIKSIYAGADDYANKPINAAELLTRIKANIWRANRDLDANPLTKLPGNVTILKEIEKKIKNNDRFCISYADLGKFKEYNDYYGFELGDKVIQHTAALISKVLLELGKSDDFLGHIGGDDFIYITDHESAKMISEKIIELFDKTIVSFYKQEDLAKGFIVVKNRMGQITAVPVMTIAIGIVTNKTRSFHHVGEIVQIATELKTYAKTFPKSIYILDRRKN